MAVPTINLWVNGKRVQLFRGATLKHALLKADNVLYSLVQNGKAKIYDQEGHEVLLEGSVADGWSYTVKVL